MNNNIINSLIIIFSILICYYLYDLYFTIYEPMDNCDKTSDYLKQDITKFENKLDANIKQINKLEQDITLMKDTINNNKTNLSQQQQQIIDLSSTISTTTASNIPKIGNTTPEMGSNIMGDLSSGANSAGITNPSK